ncbi:hypothetical protein KEM40_20555, partial [Yersinia sp. Marseille-Q3913]|nr:hypothetical protein [Yersinia sp. Marseille-Q3913]
NDNGSLTELDLGNCYQPAMGKLLRVLDYNFITNDGFILTPQWPAELQNGNKAFEPIMLAQYSPLSDSRYHALLADHLPQDITTRFDISGGKNGHSVTHLIKQPSGEETILLKTLLPLHVQLSVDEMPILMGYLPNYELLGDNGSNVFLAQHGKGLLSGGGGSDHYIVQHNPTGPMEIVINNYDSDKTTDILSFEGVEANEFVVTADGQDVILTHRKKPAEYNHFRLVNYLKDESYRHLVFLDSSDPLMREDNNLTGVRVHQIEFDKSGKLFVAPRVIDLTNDNVDPNSPLDWLPDLMASMPETERVAVSDNHHQGLKNSGTHFTVNTELGVA